MRDGIVVTGVGLVTPAGRGTQESWAGVLAGQPAAGPDPELEAAGIPVTISCRVPAFDADAELGRGASRRLDRYVHLALLAGREAVDSAGLKLGPEADPELTGRVGVVLGCGIGGVISWEEQHASFLQRGRVSPLLIPKMLSNMAPGQLAIEFGTRGPNFAVNTACAAGATALHVARDLLRSGTADIMLAGGIEAGITPLSAAAFAQMGALSRRNDRTASRPFDAERDGFVLGEGAGVLVLERAADAHARAAVPLAVFAGAGSSADAHHQTAPPEDGAGAVLAMARALADAGLEPGDVDHVNAHGTSTPLNDRAEALAVRKVFGSAADRLTVASTKGVTGHLLGAAGGVEAAFAVLAIREGVVPPTANLTRLDEAVDLDVVQGKARRQQIQVALSNSFGFGGQNEALLFAAA
ncbi:MAG: beta-ketoacyl synthase [Nitriliruptorales bacterium]